MFGSLHAPKNTKCLRLFADRSNTLKAPKNTRVFEVASRCNFMAKCTQLEFSAECLLHSLKSVKGLRRLGHKAHSLEINN